MASINKRKFLGTATAASGASCSMRDLRWRSRVQSHVLGMLINGGPSPLVDSVRQARLIEGKDLIVEPRFAHNEADRPPELAAELIRLKVDIILALGGVPAAAAAKVTNTTPIRIFGRN